MNTIILLKNGIIMKPIIQVFGLPYVLDNIPAFKRRRKQFALMLRTLRQNSDDETYNKNSLENSFDASIIDKKLSGLKWSTVYFEDKEKEKTQQRSLFFKSASPPKFSS